jgi:hypothetical protein
MLEYSESNVNHTIVANHHDILVMLNQTAMCFHICYPTAAQLGVGSISGTRERPADVRIPEQYLCEAFSLIQRTL